MDFSWDEDREGIRQLADEVLGSHSGASERGRVEAPLQAWKDLSASGLAGAALPEAWGGGGAGFTEVCLIAQALGSSALAVPFIEAVVLGALPLARFGTPEQQRRLLPGAADGSGPIIGTVGGFGEGVGGNLMRAEEHADGWVLSGELQLVAWADRAAALLVGAELADGGEALFLLPAPGGGFPATEQKTLDGPARFSVRVDGMAVTGRDLMARGRAVPGVREWIRQRNLIAVCFHQLGTLEAALKLTAAYVSEREQFGAKIGTFQAVGQRIANAYIDVDGVRLTALQALWELENGGPAERATAIACWYAADAGGRVTRSTQHLHGGIGIDLDYPLHRYYTASKRNAIAVGGVHEPLARLGDLLAAS